MGTIELANALGVSKALVSRLVGRGMPTTNPQAAQAWRETFAKPRQWKAKSGPPAASPRLNQAPPAPSTPSPEVSTTYPADGGDPSDSLRRARSAERESFKRLEEMQRDKAASPEDTRKLSSTYFAARNNHSRALSDFQQWQRSEGITMFADEARDLASRPALAAHGLLQTGAKTLAVRCHGQSVKQIEKVIGDWIDRLTETLRASI